MPQSKKIKRKGGKGEKREEEGKENEKERGGGEKQAVELKLRWIDRRKEGGRESSRLAGDLDGD